MNQPSISTTRKEASQWAALIEVTFPAGPANKAIRAPYLVDELSMLGKGVGEPKRLVCGIRSTINAEIKNPTPLADWGHFLSLKDWAIQTFDSMAKGGDLEIDIPKEDGSAVVDETWILVPHLRALEIDEAHDNDVAGGHEPALSLPSGTMPTDEETMPNPNPSLGPTFEDAIRLPSFSINADSASGTNNTSHLKPPTGSGHWSFRDILRRNKGEKPNDPSAHSASTDESKGTGAGST